MGKTWCVYHRSRRWVGKRPSHWLPMGSCEYWLLTSDLAYLMCGLPFRGVHCRGVWSRDLFVGACPGDALELRGRTDVKKVKLPDRAKVKALAAQSSEYFEQLQAVVDSLVLLQYEDGSPRQPGYLGIWTQGSTWTVRLMDKDADAQLTVEGRTLDEALDILDVHLGSENAPWEPCSRRKGKKS